MRQFTLAAIAALATGGLVHTSLAVTSYTLTDLGTLGGNESWASGINNAGQATGRAASVPGYGVPYVFLDSNGTMTSLGIIGTGTDINDNGDVVGNLDYDNAFLYQNGTTTNLGSFNGWSTRAYGINDSRQVVGYSEGHAQPSDTSLSYRAFLYDHGTMTGLGTLPGGSSSQAFGINDSGQIVGTSNTGHGSHAFLYDHGTMTDLGTLGSDYSFGVAINNAGQVTGYSVTADRRDHTFLYDHGTMTDLGTLGGSYSYAKDMNNNGDIVGVSRSADGGDDAFVYSDGTMADLNYLIPHGSPWSYWHLDEADAINDLGQIVGFATTPTGQTHAFLLTPTPEPASLSLLALGTVTLLTRRRKP